MIKSTCSARSLAELATLAPNFKKGFVKFSSKSLTVKSNLFLIKLFANFPPTLPRPTNPTFIFSPLYFFL